MIRLRCPKCRSDLEFGDSAAGRVVRCPACEARLRLPGELTADRPRRRKKRRQDDEETTEPSPTPEWAAPSVLLALGLILSIGSLAVAGGKQGAAFGAAIVGLRLLTAVPLSVAGLFIVAPLLGITFGTIGMAILKLAAINVVAVSILLNVEFAGEPGFVGYALAAPIMWMMFKWLFELDFSETMIVVTVIDLIQFLAYLTVAAATLRAWK
ncbi:MAG TPA: hypothetical protein VH120_11110 [Gemmataceae bacterium]|nr:hypothetical protein [Gemmataceae bacterium]